MSTHESPSGAVPELTIGWRIQMALTYAGLTTEDIAERLDVSRSTISRWSNDHGAPPKRIYLDAIAHATGVNPVWLKTGVPGENPDPGGVTNTTSDVLERPTYREGGQIVSVTFGQRERDEKAA